MAEGVEYGVANLDANYFCHCCSKVVSPNSLTELICPQCSNGFLEEVSHDLFESESSNSCPFDLLITEDPVALPSIPDEYFSVGAPRLNSLHQDVFERSDSLHREVFERSDSGSDTQEDQEADSSLDSFIEFMRSAPPPFPYFNGDDADDSFLRVRYFEDFAADSDVDALASQLLDEVEISGPPPLSKDQIKALPLKTLSSVQEVGDSQCTICMNDFKVGDKAKQLTCEHLFHEKCITPWLERQASCPNCRCMVKVESKSKRSLSCPRTVNNVRSRPTNNGARRFSEATSIGDFFTTSMNINPFRFL